MASEERRVAFLKRLTSDTFPLEVEIGGHPFVCHKTVYPPSMGGPLEVLAESIRNLPLPKAEGNAVLEIGSGSGCLVASFYLNNKARISRIFATDISPDAVENTRLNFSRHNIPGEARCSDVYDDLNPGEKFDLIFSNFPRTLTFNPNPDRELTMLERSSIDVGNRAFERFIGEADQYLNPNGRLVFYFASHWNSLEDLTELMAAHRKQPVLVWRKEFDTTRVLELFESVDIAN